MQNIDDSFLLKNLQDKSKPEEDVKSMNKEEKVIKPKAVRYEKKPEENLLKYDPNVNYYEEYWKMAFDNEYLTAQIKETLVEIESMKAHIQKLSNQ